MHARDRAHRRKDKDRSGETNRGRLPLLRRDSAATQGESQPTASSISGGNAKAAAATSRPLTGTARGTAVWPTSVMG